MSWFVFEKVFCEFPSLQILYLHGNAIKDIKEVDKLAKLMSLRKLSLHGNSVHTTKVFYYHLILYLTIDYNIESHSVYAQNVHTELLTQAQNE